MQRGYVAVVALFAVACGGAESGTPPAPSTHPGDWTCLTRAAADAPLSAGQPPPRRFVVSLQDAYTHASVAGVRISVCARKDEDCAAPASEVMADRAGEATLTAPGGPSSFDGFVRVSGPGIATHYVFLPGRACTGCALVLPLYTPSALEATARMTGLKPDASDAMVRADLEDCAGAPARGVSVSIGSFGRREPVVAYATGGHGGVTRAALTTDATGVALGLAVPPGPLGIAELLDGKTVAGAIGFTRGGAVSEFVVRP